MAEDQKNKIKELLSDIESSQIKKSKKKNSQEIDPKTNKTIRLALRLSVEIIAALLVSVFMGLLIDHFFDTYPLGFIIMFLIGGITGVWNVFKTLGLLTIGRKKENK